MSPKIMTPGCLQAIAALILTPVLPDSSSLRPDHNMAAIAIPIDALRPRKHTRSVGMILECA